MDGQEGRISGTHLVNSVSPLRNQAELRYRDMVTVLLQLPLGPRGRLVLGF